ncbi:hypothetical protein [Alkalihalobacterium sp. APHAB7]|uniref:hypothetical protein n=1 Tax=Alkalihalobacterium sp. APHAB7 TaxID=3402081 RepID=UPI003AAB9D21
MNMLQLAALTMTIFLGLYVIIANQLNYTNDLLFLVLLLITIGIFSTHLWKKKQKR